MAVACSTSHPLICKKSGMIQDKVVLQAKRMRRGHLQAPKLGDWKGIFGRLVRSIARVLGTGTSPQVWIHSVWMKIHFEHLKMWANDYCYCIIPKPEMKVRIPKNEAMIWGQRVATIGPEKSPPPTKAPIKNVISLAAFEGPAFFATSYNPNQWFANMAE